MIRAVHFHKEIRIGSSLPLLIGGDDGNQYVVKLNGAGDGVLASVVAWIASKLGELMGVPILPPHFVTIEGNLAEEATDPETRELLQRSVGINLGTRYLPEAAIYGERHSAGIDDSLKYLVFLYDVFLLNIDRTEMNPNMIVHDGNLWCLDYSSAMEIRSAITGEQYREHVLLQQVKRHPFYRPNLRAYAFINDLRKIQDNSIREIVDGIPVEWISELNFARQESEARGAIAETLIRKKQQGAYLGRRLDLLSVFKVETPEEHRLRSHANRKAFEKKYGTLILLGTAAESDYGM